MISRNPCQIRGAGVENPEERSVLSLAEVLDLADQMKHSRYRALILLSVFGTLRWGEVTALRRRDLAPDGSWVRVAGAFVELKGKGLVYGPPKARASLRANALPEAIRPAIVEHLARYVKDSPDAWAFTGERGNPIRSGNRNLLTGWKDAVTEAQGSRWSTRRLNDLDPCAWPVTLRRRRDGIPRHPGGPTTFVPSPGSSRS